MPPSIRHSPSGFRSVFTPQQAHHNPCIIPLQALRAITTNLARWATTVLRGHPGPSPVQQEPLEGRTKQQHLKNANHAPRAPSVPCQDRQRAFPAGVPPSLPRVSPCLPPVAVLFSSVPAACRSVLGNNPHVISGGGCIVGENVGVQLALCACESLHSWASRSWLSSKSMALLRDYL